MAEEHRRVLRNFADYIRDNADFEEAEDEDGDEYEEILYDAGLRRYADNHDNSHIEHLLYCIDTVLGEVPRGSIQPVLELFKKGGPGADQAFLETVRTEIRYGRL